MSCTFSLSLGVHLWILLSSWVFRIHPIKVDRMIWFENKIVVNLVIVSVIKEQLFGWLKYLCSVPHSKERSIAKENMTFDRSHLTLCIYVMLGKKAYPHISIYMYHFWFNIWCGTVEKISACETRRDVRGKARHKMEQVQTHLWLAYLALLPFLVASTT